MYLLAFLLLQAFNFGMDDYYIHFERSGGFAGITQSLEIKSDTLSVEDQDHLSKMIESSNFFGLNPVKDSGMPDQFNYVITIKKGTKENTLELGDSNMPANLQPLINFLTQKLRKR